MQSGDVWEKGRGRSLLTLPRVERPGVITRLVGNVEEFDFILVGGHGD